MIIRSSVKTEAANNGSTAFFADWIAILPNSGLPPSIINLSIMTPFRHTKNAGDAARFPAVFSVKFSFFVPEGNSFPEIIIREQQKKSESENESADEITRSAPDSLIHFSFSPREILYSTPMAAIVKIKEVFPELISGRGKPVGGIAPLTTSALMTTCIAYTAVMPEATRKPKRSLLLAAVPYPQPYQYPENRKQ